MAFLSDHKEHVAGRFGLRLSDGSEGWRVQQGMKMVRAGRGWRLQIYRQPARDLMGPSLGGGMFFCCHCCSPKNCGKVVP